MIRAAYDCAPENVVVITDWPHPIAAEHSESGFAAVESNATLTEASKRALTYSNPLRFL